MQPNRPEQTLSTSNVNTVTSTERSTSINNLNNSSLNSHSSFYSTVNNLSYSDLIIQNVTTPITGTVGSNIDISYQVRNIGNLTAGFHYTDFFFSKDATYSSDDTILGFQSLSGLGAGATISQNTSLKLAENIAAGNYFVIFKADGINQITESNEVNNFFAKAISINPKFEPKSDLVIQNATTAITGTVGSNIQISYQVQNIGNLTAGFHYTDFYLSKDATYSSDDTILGFQSLSGLAAGTTISQNTSLKLAENIVAGNYFVIFKADGINQITESNEVNNFFAKAISINSNNTGQYNSTSGYGLINAAAAVAKVIGQNNFTDVANLGGNNWGADLVKAPEVWAKGYTGKGVTVAVLDTGIDYNYVDLKANIWTNTKEIAGNGKDDDGNGYIDDVYGWNFADNNNNTLDKQGHGTHVAGTIAGVKNSFGVTGIAYDAKLMPVKVLDDDGSGYSSGIADGIYYAVKNGANVINLSLGSNSPTTVLMSALEYASSKGVVVVMAAGNEGTALPGYPARYADKWGLAVGAVDNNSNMANFSNRAGINPLAYVTAPGVNVYSTIPGNGYKYNSGTSMATPHVAGVVALMLSANPKLTDAQIRQIVTQTAVNGNKTTTSGLNINSLSNSSATEKKISIYSLDSTTQTPKTVEFPTSQATVKIDKSDTFVSSKLLPHFSNSDHNSYANSNVTRKPVFREHPVLAEIPK
jgi:subtilisin family serine protease